MLEHLSAEAVALWIAVFVLALFGLWRWRFRRVASRFFAEHHSGEEALREVRHKLEQVNRDCRSHVFAAEKVARFSLSDQPVCLVDGWVIVATDNGANSQRSVFAIADRDQADWMRRYSDVFEPAVSGSSCSIFWVKLPELMRLAGLGGGGSPRRG